MQRMCIVITVLNPLVHCGLDYLITSTIVLQAEVPRTLLEMK